MATAVDARGRASGRFHPRKFGTFSQRAHAASGVGHIRRRLVDETIDVAGNEPSGLFWDPLSVARATVLPDAATEFSGCLVNRYAATALNIRAMLPHQPT